MSYYMKEQNRKVMDEVQNLPTEELIQLAAKSVWPNKEKVKDFNPLEVTMDAWSLLEFHKLNVEYVDEGTSVMVSCSEATIGEKDYTQARWERLHDAVAIEPVVMGLTSVATRHAITCMAAYIAIQTSKES